MKILIILLATLVSAFSVTLTWDANTEPDIVGYTLKWGFASGTHDHPIDTGMNTIWTVSEPWPIGTTVYFVVTATNAAGMESAPSNEVFYIVPIPTPTPAPTATPAPTPAPPQNLKIFVDQVIAYLRGIFQ